MLSRTSMPSPVGRLTIVASDDGIRSIHWDGDELGPESPSDGDASAARRVALLADAVRQLGEYFAGARTEFDLPLDPQGTSFQLSAWDVLRDIPYGSTVSYAHQARRLGDVRKSRAVGAANGRNPIAIVVPCHRVVGSDGSLTGFGGGIESKAWLLDHEQRVIAGAI
ncbi:MAG: methylated-DNA--[protein]-cysteine S-methyltransferase [Actinobacteria bacterium]|nr:methylated-DNA--[protein]-cysteine S-methyltransferase [Actinomycetota bacterium]